MSEVMRNEQDKILDKAGNVVESEAGYKQSSVNWLTSEVERAHEKEEDTFRNMGSAATETYKAAEDRKTAELRRDAAEWKNHQYYRENMQGYEEAAAAEDALRTEEKAEAEQPEQTGEAQK